MSEHIETIREAHEMREAQEDERPEDDGDGALAAPDSEVPDWAVIPPDLKFPPGRQVAFIRFRAHWTDTQQKGDRQCIVWNLTDGEERIALKRAQGSNDGQVIATELAKQMVRAVDGHVADWMHPKGPGSIDRFWRDIGSRCRQMLVRWYSQNHMLSQEEQADFFENCVAVRTV